VAYLNSLIDGCHVNRVPQACIPTRGRIERHGGGTRGGKRIVLGRARRCRARGDQSAPARRGGGRVAASDGSRSSRDNADSGIVNSSLIPQALAYPCLPYTVLRKNRANRVSASSPRRGESRFPSSWKALPAFPLPRDMLVSHPASAGGEGEGDAR